MAFSWTGIQVFAAAPASAATTCNIEYAYRNGHGLGVIVPGISGSYQCSLREGNVNKAVGPLQFHLNQCNGQNLTVDGSFGRLTREALERVQRAVGADDDGIYGPETRGKMKWLYTTPTGSFTCVRGVPPSGPA
ncbi:peptidoglycan-binding domain-containing protein [Nocardia sp. NPDC051787]|uniref:peptidoglycan-binding domain-containing protein n=1 Tax=Nocardia sp. NPDC051787 TaxID=3155415 RepID=UPI0034224B44